MPKGAHPLPSADDTIELPQTLVAVVAEDAQRREVRAELHPLWSGVIGKGIIRSEPQIAIQWQDRLAGRLRWHGHAIEMHDPRRDTRRRRRQLLLCRHEAGRREAVARGSRDREMRMPFPAGDPCVA